MRRCKNSDLNPAKDMGMVHVKLREDDPGRNIRLLHLNHASVDGAAQTEATMYCWSSSS